MFKHTFAQRFHVPDSTTKRRLDKDPHGTTGDDRGLLPFREHVEFDPVRGNGSAARRAVEAAPPPRVSGETESMSVSGRISLERIVIELEIQATREASFVCGSTIRSWEKT
jgi:hypothetical protein